MATRTMRVPSRSMPVAIPVLGRRARVSPVAASPVGAFRCALVFVACHAGPLFDRLPFAHSAAAARRAAERRRFRLAVMTGGRDHVDLRAIASATSVLKSAASRSWATSAASTVTPHFSAIAA